MTRFGFLLVFVMLAGLSSCEMAAGCIDGAASVRYPRVGFVRSPKTPLTIFAYNTGWDRCKENAARK